MFGGETNSHADEAGEEVILEQFTLWMFTQGTRPLLQPMLPGLTLIPAPEKVKAHKVQSCWGPEWLCDQAYPQHHPFSLFSITSHQIISPADNTFQDRNTKPGSTQGSLAMATLAQKMHLNCFMSTWTNWLLSPGEMAVSMLPPIHSLQTVPVHLGLQEG